ncbi:hypothetical protein [Thauera linaloolentis]|uniref:Uncharacterized protein n=1 Tax=Thauera linaloolentis (strain DSM 12138 / JCM 21573 / CCUG 41526 / CIP 105981 / IAM 15112 / NBRC 102519 / 47Lol) TaxID=1123367 RepID=N6YGQ7_THAL4|nr:hypothetical protein [Thauera linaloolentis]ENO90690.1 hypothetical protein C666_00650 [Thauera linaloolentis 47Lol = DSM 12138]MCM8565598.1 hypothetical protein [Thauera linaloolentis]
MNTPVTEIPESRAKRFKARTKETHDVLDRRIMGLNPFAAQLDAVPLDAAGEARADAGAEAAFRQVFAYVEDPMWKTSAP